MEILKIKLVGGKADGTVFSIANNSKEVIDRFEMDKTKVYIINGEDYRPKEIKKDALILEYCFFTNN